MSKIEIYDATLRDGAQQEGISLSLEDKISIAHKLDDIGIHFIEGGYAGANPKEDEFFSRMKVHPLKNATLTAFGNTRRAGISAEADSTLRAMLQTETSVVTLVGKSSNFHVRRVLEVSPEENLAMVADSVRYMRLRDRRVFFDAEHFFDGYIADKDYAIQVMRAALEAGAERLILCDTNGGTLPDDIVHTIKEVKDALPEAVLGIHCHNDTETAVASTIAAVPAGVTQLQGCVNGYGERTGNANIISVIANLVTKMGIQCISDEQLSLLTSTTNFVAEIVNRRPSPFQPYVGSSAFTHKGGLHAAAIEKSPDTYQHINPKIVGNSNAVTISELSGQGNVMRRIREAGLANALGKEDARRIVKYIKEQESKGFVYESAHASFDLVMHRHLENYEAPFELMDFKVLVHAERNDAMSSEATIKVKVDEEILHTAAEGPGPVAALDNALRKALTQFYPSLKQVRLTDYKVRVVDEGSSTAALVQVTIESADAKNLWTTVGASDNILEASWLALADSLEWWLIKRNL